MTKKQIMLLAGAVLVLALAITVTVLLNHGGTDTAPEASVMPTAEPSPAPAATAAPTPQPTPEPTPEPAITPPADHGSSAASGSDIHLHEVKPATGSDLSEVTPASDGAPGT